MIYSNYLRIRQRLKTNLFLYILAVPGLLMLLVFNYVPLYGFLIAFKNFQVTKGILGSEWVGFKNFEFFLTSNDLWVVLKNTLLLNAMFIFFVTIFALVIAIFINEVRIRFFKRIVQSFVFLPFFMSWIVVSMLVDAFLGGMNPTMDSWLSALGLPVINWYQEPQVWPWILTLLKIWHEAGYLSIIFLAAITGIPDELYEAARIDGASRPQLVFRITLPLLIPTVSILTLIAVGKIFNADFGMIYAIVGDNPMLFSTTDVIDTYVFRAMRTLNDYGMSAAVGLFQSIMGFIMVLLANWYVKKYSDESKLF